MTNPGSPPESPKKGFKLTLMQGVIGAASLAGTTAIPLLVQRTLTSPLPTPIPVQSTSAEIKPAQLSPASASPESLEDDNNGKGRKKGKKHD
ncbi:hypothetical protein JOY44_19340 [Phormidium sp. CLA17]|uniref:hypothetical protein n=1 Tax=Leptolyngbya sp. Cla-17 TaxID=2803751 RepID=UPI001491BD36|nr:hypothetical protein [Leptolyngbya sp. Cla-17]MBM0743745.1 hypothetical protein [Leptolyngbya sp. Cla-17]